MLYIGYIPEPSNEYVVTSTFHVDSFKKCPAVRRTTLMPFAFKGLNVASWRWIKKLVYLEHGETIWA
jgi:hypothetical protein